MIHDPARGLGLVAALLTACAGGSTDEPPAQAGKLDAGAGDARADRGEGGSEPSCPDADGDGVPGCDGDCDDANPYIQPGARELCDGLDNNCNGETDEDYPTLGQACGDGLGACAAAGHLVCAPNAVAVTCDSVVVAPAEETCDGLDQDCDGSVDEGAPTCCEPGETQPCGVEEGECRIGVSTCDERSVFGPCDGGRAPAETESCDGLDEDCDGRTDEDLREQGQACETEGMGVCGPGTSSCEGGHLVCLGVGTMAQERCNGVDDDCDGETDEGVRNGLGECCAAAAETCNGQDDDCDGRLDEGTAAEDRVCVTARGTFEGRIQGGRAGFAVHIVADQNGDGFADVLIGAPGPPSPADVAGAVYLVSGRNGQQLDVFNGEAADGELGYAFATADLTGDGTDEWLVTAPDAQSGNNHHGSVHVLEAGTFRSLDTLNGNASGSRFGESVAAGATTAGEPPAIIVGQPVLSGGQGRVAVYSTEFDAGTSAVRHSLRWEVEGELGGEQVGVAVGLAPADGFGRQVLYIHGDDGAPRDTELVLADPANGMAMERLAAPVMTGETFGRILASTESLPLMATGAWGAESRGSTRGAAWLFWPDGEIVDEMTGLDAEAHLGFSVAVAAGLRVGSDLTWCAGAVATALDPAAEMPRAGYALCRSESGAPVATVAGGSPGDGFGWSMALASAPDPDGGVLLVVGAPRSARVTADGGMVHLFRLVHE